MTEATVLLVDDEKEFLEALSARMEARGLKVQSVTSGAEALAKATDEDYDAIVLDMLMPEMDGIETLRRLRSANPDVQVILLTGHATVKKGIEAIKIGALDFLEKPAELEDLLDKIREAKAKKMVLVQKRHEEKISEILKTKAW